MVDFYTSGSIDRPLDIVGCYQHTYVNKVSRKQLRLQWIGFVRWTHFCTTSPNAIFGCSWRMELRPSTDLAAHRNRRFRRFSGSTHRAAMKIGSRTWIFFRLVIFAPSTRGEVTQDQPVALPRMTCPGLISCRATRQEAARSNSVLLTEARWPNIHDTQHTQDMLARNFQSHFASQKVVVPMWRHTHRLID